MYICIRPDEPSAGHEKFELSRCGPAFGSRVLLTLASWPPKVLATLGICALVLMIGSFIYLSHFSGSPPGSTYEPAHVEDGKFVPGRVVR